MDSETARLLTDFVQKVGWLRKDMQQKKEYERYEHRFVRIEQKFSVLAELISRSDPDLAKALRTAFQMPARDSAFKNAEHQKRMKAPGVEDN
jgi:hypothetical protein